MINTNILLPASIGLMLICYCACRSAGCVMACLPKRYTCTRARLRAHACTHVRRCRPFSLSGSGTLGRRHSVQRRPMPNCNKSSGCLINGQGSASDLSLRHTPKHDSRPHSSLPGPMLQAMCLSCRTQYVIVSILS